MNMDPRLQAWLDGELGFDDLPETLRAEASAWTSLLEGARSLDVPGAAPRATARVMDAIRADAITQPSPLAGFGRSVADGLRWIVRPRPVPVSPLAAAVVIAVAAWAGVRLVGAGAGLEGGRTAGAPASVYVQFVIAAPEASSVALAGDFNEWDPSIQLLDPDLDGVWTARVALEAGVHEYMFVIDGTEWRPDPNALSYADDGFGRRNSVLAVAPLDET